MEAQMFLIFHLVNNTVITDNKSVYCQVIYHLDGDKFYRI